MSHIVNDKNLDNLVEDIKGMTLQELLDDIADSGASFNERFNLEMWNVAFKKNVERFENKQELQTAEHLLMNSN